MQVENKPVFCMEETKTVGTAPEKCDCGFVNLLAKYEIIIFALPFFVKCIILK